MRKTRSTPAGLLKILLLAFIATVALASFDIGLHLPDPSLNSIAYVSDSSQRISGVVVRSEDSEDHQQLTLSNLAIEGRPFEDRILVFAPLFPEFTYGDSVTVRCNLRTPEPFDGFAYDSFLASKRVYKTCFTNSSPLLVSTGGGSPVKGVLWSVREEIIERIDQTFGEPHGSLLAGLLLGEQRFTKQWNDIFIATGTSHIVAASGYNVTIVVFLLFGLLTRFGIKRQQAFYALVAGVVGYVIVAGGDAAVMRAGVMGVLVLLSRQLGRKADMMNIVLLTATVMLAVNPYLFRHDVGFQLSMMSTIALIYFAPVLDSVFRFVPEKYGIRESLSATLAATIFSLPIIFLSFGRISIIGPIANLLILPIIPYAMALGSSVIAVSFASTGAAVILSGPAWLLLSVTLFVVKSLAAIPAASLQLSNEVSWLAALASVLIIIFLWRRTVRTRPAYSRVLS